MFFQRTCFSGEDNFARKTPGSVLIESNIWLAIEGTEPGLRWIKAAWLDMADAVKHMAFCLEDGMMFISWSV